MQKIGDISNSLANIDGEFTDGNVAGGVAPTRLLAKFFNTIQRELVGVVEGCGLELNSNDDGQLLVAIQGYVQKKGFSFSQVNKQDVSQFTVNDFGRRVWVNNDSPSEFTLPDISNINSSGQTITIWNLKNTAITISVGNQSDNISLPLSKVKSFKLMSTESVTLIIEQNNWWHATGDGVLKYSPLFRASTTEHGWSYHPSGLIEQWGICNASGNISVEAGYLNSFPIPFPNKCVNLQLTHNGFSPGSAGVFSAMVLSNNAQFRAYSSMGNIYPAGTAYYRAIGY